MQRDTGPAADGRIGEKLALIVGYLALAGGVFAGWNDPPTGYEVSIYAATPVGFWVGIGVALLAATIVALLHSAGYLRGVALVLGSGAVAALLGLPLVRDYYFYGTADALTHLGWVKDIADGAIQPETLLYPALHLFSVSMSAVSGFPLRHSLMVIVFLLSVIVFVFVPLIVRLVTPSTTAAALAGFSAFLLLPVNNLSTHPHAHPFSQTTLFSALLLFLVLKYALSPSTDDGGSFPSATTVLIGVVATAAVLYHPLAMVNVLVLLVAVAAVQFLYRVRSSHNRIKTHRPIYAQTLLVGVIFFAWVLQKAVVRDLVSQVAGALMAYVQGRPQPAGSAVAAQGASLTAIGVNLPELFTKLFLVSAVYAGLAALIALPTFAGRYGGAQSDVPSVVVYLSAGVVPVFVLTAIFFAGDVSSLYFRELAFIMLIVSIVASFALARFTTGAFERNGSDAATTAVAVLFAVLLPLALVTVFPSPFMYKPTQHVTATEMTGYQTAFEDRNASLTVAGLRGGHYRYSDAIYGTERGEDLKASVEDQSLSDLPGQFEEDTGYLLLSEYDRQRETVAYNGLRFGQDGFRSLDTQPRVDRVSSNGDVNLYYVSEDEG